MSERKHSKDPLIVMQPDRGNNEFGGNRAAMIRTEVTIETHRMLVIHRPGTLFEGQCLHCNKQVAMIRLENAALAGISGQAIRRLVKADRLHFIAGAGGLSFICLNSLLEQI